MSRWRRARIWVPLLVIPLVVTVVVLVALDRGPYSGQARVPAAPRMSDEGRSLLGGLSVGDQLMGWTVQALDGPTEGVLRIDLERDEVRFALMVVGLGSRPELPPVKTERYAVYFGHVLPKEVTLPEGTIRATTHALARRVREHEGAVEVPGM